MKTQYFIQGYEKSVGFIQTDERDKVAAIRLCLRWKRDGVENISIIKTTSEDITYELEGL